MCSSMQLLLSCSSYMESVIPSSLLAAPQVIQRLQQVLHRPLLPDSIFHHPTNAQNIRPCSTSVTTSEQHSKQGTAARSSASHSKDTHMALFAHLDMTPLRQKKLAAAAAGQCRQDVRNFCRCIYAGKARATCFIIQPTMWESFCRLGELNSKTSGLQLHANSLGREVPVSPLDRDYDVRMEAQVIFDSCWRRFEERYRLKAVHVPREVVWLNGAPGAGKGANTQHILKTRGLDHSICISSLLQSHPDTKAAIDRGDMIPDTTVVDVLLEALLVKSCVAAECGVLVDGFPRTALQVDLLKLLHDKLHELHAMWANTPYHRQFPRPLFKVVVLYVDEETSIRRQLERAKLASLHNKRVIDAGGAREQRITDTKIDTCKKRYEIFRQHYSAVLRLKQFFAFHLIDAMGSLAETQEAITTELRYQSSLDLSYETYAAIRHLPLARDVAQHARQALVSRLEQHQEKYPDLFQKVIDLITTDVMPLLHDCGLSGRVEYVTEHRMFSEQPRAAQMLIDVLTDRGYGITHTVETVYVPIQFDLQTGVIKNRKEVKHKFLAIWDVSGIRDIAKALESAARVAEANAGVAGKHISQTFIPIDYPKRNSPKHSPSNCSADNDEVLQGGYLIHGS